MADLDAGGLSVVANDYKYRNHDKKENIYDDKYNIIEQYYPIERNRSVHTKICTFYRRYITIRVKVIASD